MSIARGSLGEGVIEFESPATRIIKQFSGKDEEQFRIPVDLPDITFLRALSIQGRLRYFNGSGIAPISITPNVGETLFIYRTILSPNDANASTFTFVNDGNNRFTIVTGSATTGTDPSVIDIMDSIVGDGTKVLTLTPNRDNSLCSLLGWVENTSRIRDVAI